MGDTEYGYLTMITSFVALIASLLHFGLPGASIFLYMKFNENRDDIFSFIYCVFLLKVLFDICINI